MKQSDAAINSVLQGLKRLNLSHREVIVACSGGVDSMALLFCATKLKNVVIKCAHVTYDIRPKAETDEDLRVVKTFCDKHNIELLHYKCEPKKQHELAGGNLEDIASIMRHQFFEVACGKKSDAGGWISGARCVATAHHADDQLETVLMKLGRGCGLRGLSGIAPYYHERGMILIRPMLGITKADCKAICLDNGIEWHEDHTNKDTDMVRNHIRHKILPILKELFPEIAQNTTDAGAICESAQKVVTRSLLDNLFRHQTDMTSSSRRSILIEAVRLAEDIEIYEWLVSETRGIGGDASRINKFMLDKVIDAIRGKKTKTFNWVGGIAINGSVVEVNQDELMVRHKREQDATNDSYSS